MYPIFYLLKGDYRGLGLRCLGFRVWGPRLGVQGLGPVGCRGLRVWGSEA